MFAIIEFLCGFVSCAALVLFLHLIRSSSQRALPPGTRRQVERAARANRADIRRAQHDRRNWLPPSTDDFDGEETR